MGASAETDGNGEDSRYAREIQSDVNVHCNLQQQPIMTFLLLILSFEFLLFLTIPEWAESLTEMGKGKHFIGDFLPPEELEKFMETFKALKVGSSLT